MTTYQTPDERIAACVGFVLANRAGTPMTPLLRRGMSPASAVDADAALAKFWSGADYVREPFARLAGLAAAFPHIGQNDEVPFGKLVAILDKRSALGAKPEDGFARGELMVALMQRQSDRLAFHTMQRVFGACTPSDSVNWFDVARLLTNWNHTNRRSRNNIRRRPLSNYHA